MGDMGEVIELWRYPVSSLAGELMQSISVTQEGADGDRLYGLVEADTGEIARPDRNEKWHEVPRIKVRLSRDRRLEIATPDGEWIAAPGSECDRAISAYLGFDAAILPFEGDSPSGYAGQTTAPRYTKAPLHLLTTASLARLKALHPTGDPDRRRFRPSILVDMPEVEGSFPETEWIGRKLAIGEVELTISDPCRRCGFTIIGQDGFDNDPSILRNIVRHNAHNIGVYCQVDKPGTIGLGDQLRFL